MGIALMMEGVLSACYHVCPNYSNFQFGKPSCLLFVLEGFAICISCRVTSYFSPLYFCKASRLDQKTVNLWMKKGSSVQRQENNFFFFFFF